LLVAGFWFLVIEWAFAQAVLCRTHGRYPFNSAREAVNKRTTNNESPTTLFYPRICTNLHESPAMKRDLTRRHRGLAPEGKQPGHAEVHSTLIPLLRDGPVGPCVCRAGRDSRSRGVFFVQSCLPTRVRLWLPTQIHCPAVPPSYRLTVKPGLQPISPLSQGYSGGSIEPVKGKRFAGSGNPSGWYCPEGCFSFHFWWFMRFPI
jgi:hypothetical protein